MMKNNDLITVKIAAMNSLGEGLAQKDGEKIIVRGAITGDLVEARVVNAGRNQNIAVINKLLKNSPDRVKAPCKLCGRCGSCQLQVMDYKKQLDWKRQKVFDELTRAGNNLDNVPVYKTIGMEEPWHYRNKTQLPVGKDRKGRYIAGFYADRTHELVAQDDCLLASPVAAQITRIILEFLEKHRISPHDEKSGSGVGRHLLIREGTVSKKWLVSIVINGRELPFADELVAKLLKIPGMTSISLSVNTENTNVIMGRELIPLCGPLYIDDQLENLTFRIGPLTFYQVNSRQTVRLYRTALDYAALTGNEDVWDLYCGIGTISLFLAQKARRVRGVEIVPEAIENARENASHNGITNTEFYVGKAEEVVPEIFSRERAGADVVVVDPPRKGCDRILLDTILQMSPQRLVYVSCNPSTLARDVRYLTDSGKYRLSKVQPVDMFPHTEHVETVALLEK